MKHISIIILVGLMIFYGVAWKFAWKEGYLIKNEGGIWKRTPSYSASFDRQSVAWFEIPFVLVEYVVVGRKSVKASDDYFDKHIAGTPVGNSVPCEKLEIESRR